MRKVFFKAVIPMAVCFSLSARFSARSRTHSLLGSVTGQDLGPSAFNPLRPNNDLSQTSPYNKGFISY